MVVGAEIEQAKTGILTPATVLIFSNLRLMIFVCKIAIIDNIKETGSLSSLTENR